MLPNGAVTISPNIHDKIVCASCGKSFIYGASYCSLIIHTPHGIGYCVCEDCHKKELEKALLYRD